MALLHITEKTSLYFTILLTFLSLFKCFVTSQPNDFIDSWCFVRTKYNANSKFSDNLHKTLDSLIDHGAHDGFYNESKGENPDRVFGLVGCRSNVSPDECRRCIETARKGVTQDCLTSKTAFTWYDLCLLHYSDEEIFSSRGFQDMDYHPSLNGASRQYPFERVLAFLIDMSLEATLGRPNPPFATRKMSLDFGVYGMVRCSSNLSRWDCYQCLTAAAYRIPNSSYTSGGRVGGSSCNLRVESYPFDSFDPTYSPPPLGPRARGNSSSRLAVRDRLPSGYIIAVVVIAIITTIMLICTVATCILKRPKKKENCRVNAVVPEVSLEVIPVSGNAEPLKFDLGAILAATSNFSEENKLRESSFGHVYKGILLDGREIVVKRFSRNSGQSVEQLKNEVVVTGRLHHKNLVRLLGYCVEGDEKFLVYEYVSNRSLDYYLNDPARRGQLGWDTRFMIIKGIAQGLLYLHEESPYEVVHRDLKASNILLDSELCPKISGFGFSRSLRGNQIVGTYGHMVSDNAMHEQFSMKSDVFSFGVLAIEIVSGRKRGDFRQSEQAPDLLHYIWKRWIEGKVLELMDPTLVESCSITEVLRCIHVGLLCVQEHPTYRPTMSAITRMLNGKPIHLQPNSPPPLFSIGSSPDRTDPPSS